MMSPSTGISSSILSVGRSSLTDDGADSVFGFAAVVVMFGEVELVFVGGTEFDPFSIAEAGISGKKSETFGFTFFGCSTTSIKFSSVPSFDVATVSKSVTSANPIFPSILPSKNPAKYYI